MTKLLISECHGIDIDEERGRFVFIGDSPNDAPMFEYFPLAIGVANVRDFGSRIAHTPAYVTQASCGEGFREAAECILAGRQASSQQR
jgi:hydroxymethylpyrimidine pyrophosphatase-like HAD family hydrolase